MRILQTGRACFLLLPDKPPPWLLAACCLGAVLTGCGTDIAQTAAWRSPEPIDCTPPTTPASFPEQGPMAVATGLVESPLSSNAYVAGAGPGILIAARDAVRLYVNGELLLESAASLAPQFVPFSFLPGENVVAVTVAASARQPLLLVRLDELESSTVSDATWKIQASPAAGWTGIEFDDSAWAVATDYGAASGCAAVAPSFAEPAARFIGAPDPSVRALAFRHRFTIAPDGFGAATTGGGRAFVEVAKDVAAFRALVETDDAARVVALPEGLLDFRPPTAESVTQLTCPTACSTSSLTQYVVLPTGTACGTAEVAFKRDDRQIHVRSNKTIVGLGRGAQLRGAWFDLTGSANVILRNLAWFDVNPGLIEAGDGVTMSASSRIWIDHCSFKWLSDGFTDLNASSSQITLSWNSFDGTNTAECRARHQRANELVDAEATLHHSLWKHVDGRAPFVHGASARAHLYNNVVLDAVDYAVGAGCLGQVLVEGCYFEDVAAPTARRDCVETPGQLGLIQAPLGSNDYGAGTGGHVTAGAISDEPHDRVFTPDYAYTLEPVTAIRFRVPEGAGAGARWAIPMPND